MECVQSDCIKGMKVGESIQVSLPRAKLSLTVTAARYEVNKYSQSFFITVRNACAFKFHHDVVAK